MKTNQVLIRKMGNYTVKQRTCDSMFNATELLKQWNESTGMQKKIDHFFENNSSHEFIETIEKRENLNTRNSVYLKIRGKNGGTWMHPLLFIDFAMWINPSFKYDVLKFVYDELIKHRNDAGDAYRDMSKAISKIVDKSLLVFAIPEIARALNYVIFNSHEPQIRNKADEIKMKELLELEKDVCKLIDFGFIGSMDNLKSYLRKQWYLRWQPACLTA